VSEQTTVRLKLPLIIANQAQKHITHNEALTRLDALVQASVKSRTLIAQPSSPGQGDAYILPASPTGADWGLIGTQKLVRFEDGYWSVIDMALGSLVYVEAETAFVVKSSTSFIGLNELLKSFDQLARLGIGTTADDYNRLALKSQAALLGASYTSEGGTGSFSLSLNKQNTSDNAQILWQKDYVSRLIMGLLGNDHLSVKASADGQVWREALSLHHRSGRLRWRLSPYQTPNALMRRFVTGRTWLISITPADNDWQDVTYAPELGLFAAVASTGTGNRVMTSPDGITWTARTSAADLFFNSIIWAPELSLFVAVASSGTGSRAMTSPDGVTWTLRTTAADLSWQSVCYARELGLLVAVAASGTGNRVMTSANGVTWVSRISAADNDWRCVTYAAELGLFVAVASTGSANRVMTSPDGITWTTRTSAANNDWQGVAFAPEQNRLVAVASTGTGDRVMTSDDGIVWVSRTSAANQNWQGISFSPLIGLWVAVGSSGTGQRLMTSVDGVSWALANSAADNAWSSLIWADELGLFCAVGSTGTANRAMTCASARAQTYRS
jgi:hypothetical protein